MKSKEYHINEMLESIQVLMEKFDESVGGSSLKKRQREEKEGNRNLDIIDISLPSSSHN